MPRAKPIHRLRRGGGAHRQAGGSNGTAALHGLRQLQRQLPPLLAAPPEALQSLLGDGARRASGWGAGTAAGAKARPQQRTSAESRTAANPGLLAARHFLFAPAEQEHTLLGNETHS